MGNKAKQGRKKHAQTRYKTRTSYTDGCYAVPIRFLYGTAAEINFWDVVYFRARAGGGEFDTSTGELVEQMGLSRQMMGRLRREAVERGELVQDVSWVSGRRFVLRAPDFDRLTKGVVWKPLGYVRNGWHRIVTPAIPKRVLNLYLQQPRQRVYRLDPAYVAAKCKRRFLHNETRSAAPLNSADVGKALRLLVRLGLLTPDGDGFCIDWDTFDRPAPTDAPSFQAPDTREHSSFVASAAINPERAERTLELLNTGHYDVDIHFADIFRDLAYVRGSDYALLKAKVHRHRNRPPGPNRWRDTWRAFQYELKRRVAEIRSAKSVLHLGEATCSDCSLALPLDQVSGRVLAVRMVSRVEWPWYFKASDGAQSDGAQSDGAQSDGAQSDGALTVRLELRSGDRTLFARAVGPGDSELRYALHPDEWTNLAASLALIARCDRPLPDVHVEAWLEARLRRESVRAAVEAN